MSQPRPVGYVRGHLCEPKFTSTNPELRILAPPGRAAWAIMGIRLWRQPVRVPYSGNYLQENPYHIHRKLLVSKPQEETINSVLISWYVAAWFYKL